MKIKAPQTKRKIEALGFLLEKSVIRPFEASFGSLKLVTRFTYIVYCYMSYNSKQRYDKIRHSICNTFYFSIIKIGLKRKCFMPCIIIIIVKLWIINSSSIIVTTPIKRFFLNDFSIKYLDRATMNSTELGLLLAF